MKRLIIFGSLLTGIILILVLLKYAPGMSGLIWELSGQGGWLLPLVLFSALLDSVHPCSFSILLITIAFLFGMQLSRKKILMVGGVYIAGIFAAYFLIGLGLLKVLHLFNTPHFMGKVGATLLIVFGLINLFNYLFPKFPIRLKIPSIAHGAMGTLIDKATIPAAFGLGLLVGICQFPCMGGPYLMVIGLLRDQVTYMAGFGYLFFYNILLILPLIAVLIFAADKVLVEKMQVWKTTQMQRTRLWAGIAMLLIGILVFFI